MLPCLTYAGNKQKELAFFLKYIPAEYDRYIEPFLGSGALFFYLEPASAILNDIHPGVMDFYKDLRNNWPRMRAELDQIQAEYDRNKAEFLAEKKAHPGEKVRDANKELFRILRILYNKKDPSFLQGTLYYYLNKQAFSGIYKYNLKKEFVTTYGYKTNFNSARLTKEHSDCLKHAQLYNTEYRDIFALAGENDFMFLDPPYDCDFNRYGNGRNSFTRLDQCCLASAFLRLPCKALMVIGKTKLTEALYREYILDEYFKRYEICPVYRREGGNVHLVIANYRSKQ